ncbi:MAG: GAF domain-containing protein [Kofleriaceae bacterium]|nr:GAF domain-containing protein [Kofleriaceae bacterium]
MSTTSRPRATDTNPDATTLPISVVDPAQRRELLDHPSHSHIVQFYEADGQLIGAVSQYLLAGLDAGEPLVIIATAEHRAAFSAALAARGFDVDVLSRAGRLTMLDARETLSLFMVGDTPDAALFDASVGGVLARVQASFGSRSIRAYGEMVDILWRDGNPDAALRVEGLWNELGRRRSFSLFCAYVMGNFYRVDGVGGIEAVCAAHSHVLQDDLDIDALREHARALQKEIEERKHLEAALRSALQERSVAQAQLEALQRIGKALHSELDLEKIVQRVTDEATAICHAEFGAFFYNVVEPEGERYTLYTLAGVPRERFARFPMPRNTAVFGPTFRGEGVVRLDDVTKDPRYGKNAPYYGMPEGHLPVCSYLAAPVVARSGEVLGGLFFGHSKPGVFDKADENGVIGIAAHAAIAIENARAYEEQRRARIAADEARVAAEQARERTERLQRITVELSRALGAEELSRIVIAETSALAGVEAGSVVLLDEAGTAIESFVIDAGVSEPVAVQARAMDLGTRAPIFDAIRTGALVWVVGADEIDRRYPELASLRAAAGAQTWGALPIMFEGRPLGAVGFSGSTARVLSDEDRAFLLALGRQCGQAVERARLHDATLAARAEAEQANRAKDDFLAMLGHELRNPLSPILTAVHLMRIRGETSTLREQSVIERQVNHLIHLVDELLDISRITRGKVELERKPHKLSTIVSKAVEVVTPLVDERRHQLTISLPDEELWLDVDDVRICQVLTNLLTNAARYTERGGQLALCAAREDSCVVIRVKDNGVGMPPELLPRVFDLFVQGYRTSDRSQGGLGVGLALVRNLVVMHGGSVGVASAGPGKGSELTVRLPIIVPNRAVAATGDGERSIREGVSVTSRRILVVDDNVDAATLLADLLRTVGHDVRVAHDGAVALDIQARFHPEIGILDIGLPRMDGYELATIMRERAARTIRLMAVTGYGQEQDRARAERAGFDAHFVKPVALAKLLTEIELRSGGEELPANST